MKKIVLVFIVMMTLSACKSDKKEVEKVLDEIEEVEEEKSYVKVTFNAVVPKDDTFAVQYKKEDNVWYPKKGIETKVLGSSLPQDMVFNLPPDIFPIDFILLLGENNTENVIMNSVTFELEGRSFTVPKEKFFDYFSSNKLVDFNKADNSYKLNEKGNGLKFFNARKVLVTRLEQKLY